jgi:hypothetical protein
MTGEEIKKLASDALKQMEEAILALLGKYEGLTNSEIAEKLNLHSSHEGGQKDYLTYSVLGILMDKKKVEKIKYHNSRNPIYRLKKVTKVDVEKKDLKTDVLLNNGCKRAIVGTFKKRF